MIITKTPFRISFFGGGTDYPVWFREHGGAVLSTTINKYCYITCRPLPPFFDYKSRIVWSHIEMVKNHDEIVHPAVRGILKHFNFNEGVEITHNADLPARTGLGAGSSFVVGLLQALHSLQGTLLSKEELAKMAIATEQDVLRENVGCQDQIAAAFGGLNKIEFDKQGGFHISPVTLLQEKLQILKNHLMLIFTGFSHTASDIAAEQIKTTSQKEQELRTMQQMVDEALKILHSDQDLSDFGRLLHESWQLKRTLTDKISTPKIDQIYETAREAGALGGKLLGAGGGGFMLMFVKPEKQPVVRTALRGLLEVPFDFENAGTQVIFYKPNH